MDAGTLGVMVPIVAVGGAFLAGITRTIASARQRELELRLHLQQGQSGEVRQEIEALRAEIGTLRDTSTQFDMALEHTVQHQEERLKRLEIKAAAGMAAPDEQQQRLGLR